MDTEDSRDARLLRAGRGLAAWGSVVGGLLGTLVATASAGPSAAIALLMLGVPVIGSGIAMRCVLQERPTIPGPRRVVLMLAAWQTVGVMFLDPQLFLAVATMVIAGGCTVLAVRVGQRLRRSAG